jgi:hypothetical protein
MHSRLQLMGFFGVERSLRLTFATSREKTTLEKIRNHFINTTHCGVSRERPHFPKTPQDVVAKRGDKTADKSYPSALRGGGSHKLQTLWVVFFFLTTTTCSGVLRSES